MLKYLIDILFLIIAIVTVIIFTRRGFVQSLFQYGRTYMAVIIAYVLGPIVGKFIYNNFIYNAIYNWVSERVNSVVHSVTGAIDIDRIIEEIPLVVRKLSNSEKIKAEFGEKIEDFEVTLNELSALASQPFAKLVSNLISYVLVFLLALLFLLIIWKLLDWITTLPVLHGLNAFLGFLFGILAAFILLSSLTYVLSVVISIFGDVLSLEKMSESSYLFGFFDKIRFFILF